MIRAAWGIFYFLLGSSLAVAFLFAAPLSATTQYSNLIVFGDSYSDVGNNTWLDVPGRGTDFAHGAPVSNLDPKTKTPRIWVQYLVANHIFKRADIMPSRLWHSESLSEVNVDYAWAGAEAGKRFINDLSHPFSYPKDCPRAGYLNRDLSCVPGVLLQVKQYLHDLKHNDEKPGQKTMFVIWAGENDVIDNVQRFFYRLKKSEFKLAAFLPQQAMAFSWLPGKKIHDAVESLMTAGVPAQHIYVFTLPNLAKTPGVKYLVRSKLNDSVRQQAFALLMFTDISELYNKNLRFWLTYGLRGENKPKIISIESLFRSMSSDNHFLGYHFLDVDNSCVRMQATPYCTGFLFFDDEHPSTTTGELLSLYVAQHL